MKTLCLLRTFGNLYIQWKPINTNPVSKSPKDAVAMTAYREYQSFPTNVYMVANGWNF